MADSLGNFTRIHSIGTDDTGPAASECGWASNKADLVLTGSADHKGTAVLRFAGTDATGETINWSVYACDSDGDPLQYVAHGTATLGATETGTTDEYYANAISITNAANWLSTISKVNGYQYNMGTGAVANGGIAVLKFDTAEYDYIRVYLSKGTCASAAVEMKTVPNG